MFDTEGIEGFKTGNTLLSYSTVKQSENEEKEITF